MKVFSSGIFLYYCFSRVMLTYEMPTSMSVLLGAKQEGRLLNSNDYALRDLLILTGRF